MHRYFFVALLIGFFSFNSHAQSQPKWKLDYDSAQFFWNNNASKSLRFLQNAERIALNDLGVYDENYLAIASDLGLAYAQMKDFKNAERYLIKNLTIEREIFRPEDPRILQAKYNLATVIIKSGDDVRGMNMLKGIVYQPHHTDHGDTYLVAAENLMQLYEAHEQYDSALIVVRNALMEKFSEPFITKTHVLMLAEGRILRKMKKYSEATLVLSTINNTIKGASQSVPFIANAIQVELSLLDIEMGLYGKAEANMLQLYKTLKNIPDTDEELLTELANGLAYVYEKLGVYDRALLYYNESFNRCSTSFGSTSFGCVIIENNMAGIYLKQGLIKKSIVEYERFIRMIRDFSKTNTTVYLIALNNLATAYRQDGQYDVALKYFNEINLALEKRGNLQEDLAATVMNNLAVTYMLKGEYSKATEYFERVLVIKERLFGSSSPVNLDVVGNLAVSYWVAHRYKEALPLFQKSLALAEKEVKYVFPTLTEVEQVQFYEKQKENFERFNTLAVQSSNTQPEYLVQMFNNQLLLKSLVFFTNKKRNTLINSKGQEHLKNLVALAQTKGVQLGHLYQMPMSELKSLGLSITKKEMELDSLDKLIRVSLQSEHQAEPDVEWKDIRKSLKPNEALIDIIRFRKYDVFDLKSSTAQQIQIGFTDSVYYAVLVTSTETENYPQLVLLKNGTSLEKRNLKYYRNTMLYDMDDAISYSQYWKPFEAYVLGKKKIYVCADGVYHKINLNAIHDESGKFLLEKYDLHTVLNSAQLNSNKTANSIDLSKVVLIGDPIFNLNQPDLLGIKNADNKRYKPLPGTRDEINGIASALKQHAANIDIFVRESASEANLKNLHSPSILHIATHGFFSSNVVYLNESVKNDFLFHSGILLSGENHSATNLNNTFDNDGIVTAYDVMNLDLTNTELVVLSACETGLGKTENSEGVFGLQRSFLQAGATDILISLWKVDDVATKDLMIKFYTYLSQHYEKREAFKLAQLDMLHKATYPRLWGGFVMVSDE